MKAYQNDLLRWSIDQGHRVHVLRHRANSHGHIVQKIKGEVCWVRVPKRPVVEVEVPQLEFYDEVFDIQLPYKGRGLHHWARGKLPEATRGPSMRQLIDQGYLKPHNLKVKKDG